jgi:carbonic anhydrase
MLLFFKPTLRFIIMKSLPLIASVFFLVYTAGIAIAETINHSDSRPSASHELHWEYAGQGGPKNWGKIKSEYKACRLGQFQSPVDLKARITADLPALEINYTPAPLSLLNNGHTVQVNYPEGSTMVVEGTVFELLQFHFHTPSEHKINGKSYDMELHFVHKTHDGQLGVLGVMIEPGKHNVAAQTIWDHMPMSASAPQTYQDVTIDGSALLPQKLGYFRLMGSLTTPPCSEGVNWHILANPIDFSEAQIDKFKQAFPANARPVQAINSRLIVLNQ